LQVPSRQALVGQFKTHGARPGRPPPKLNGTAHGTPHGASSKQDSMAAAAPGKAARDAAEKAIAMTADEDSLASL